MVHADTKATIVHVGPLQVNDQINVPLQSAFDQQKWRIFEVSAGAQQVVNMPATVDDFRTSLSRNLRKNHDRRKRSLEAMGQFEITYYNDCWVVCLDAKPIAYSLAIDSGSCRYSISGQYDEEYKKHGVGIIADMSMFEQAIESGKTIVNMGDGDSDYKRRWGAEPSAELLSLYIFRPSIVGRLGHTALRTLDRLRHSKAFYRLNRYF